MLKVIVDYFISQWYTISNEPSFFLATLIIGFAFGWLTNSVLQKSRVEATEERLKAIEERYKLKDEQLKDKDLKLRHLESQLVSFTAEVSHTGEELIKGTSLDYYLPNATFRPSEVSLLKMRGFQKVSFHDTVRSLQNSSGNVLVLDLKNCISESNQNLSGLLSDEEQEVAQKHIDSVLKTLSHTTVLVVYTRRIIRYLYSISAIRHVLVANNQGVLIGAVVNAVYVSANEASSSTQQTNNLAEAGK